MKKLFTFLFIGIFCIPAINAQKVTINGRLQFTKPVQKIFLSYRNGDDRVSDSTDLKGGKFTFKGKLVEPTMASLMVRFEPEEGGKRGRIDRMQFFIEPGKIEVRAKDSLKFAKISGSKAQKEYEAYSKLLTPYDEKEATFGPRYTKFRESGDEAGMKSIQEESRELAKDRNENVVKPYITSHPGSPIVLNLLNQFLGYDIDPTVAEPLYEDLSEANKVTYSGKSLKERIEIAKKTTVGEIAMNFSQNDTLDKPVSLSDFRGKYVLLDFWASWCGPCRAENPNVVQAFNKYKDKNFTVLGVSLDQEGAKQAWMDAIHKDGLTWTHVSDLKFWDNAVAKEWGIRAIPQNFLIDPNGKIVAKNIRGDKLNEKLSEILD